MDKVPVGKFGFLDESVIAWLKERAFTIAGAVLALGALIAWMVSQNSASDYRVAESVFNRWNGSAGQELVQLTKLIKQHPELHAKYDGRIAQKLLLRSEKGLAEGFSRPIFKRVEPSFPHFAAFSRGSLLIGEKKLSEALTAALQLQKQLSLASSKRLFGYNLLRIAILQQTLHAHPADELAAWEAFEKNQDPETYNQICRTFQRNDISLKEFIQHRKLILEQRL